VSASDPGPFRSCAPRATKAERTSLSAVWQRIPRDPSYVSRSLSEGARQFHACAVPPSHARDTGLNVGAPLLIVPGSRR
jgi:hypothetical protein